MAEEEDEWQKKQLEPLGMFDLANKWAEAVKVIGAGNAAGVVAAGAALNTFAQRPEVLGWIKGGGIFFFIGIFTFAGAFALIHLSTFTYDEMLHSARRGKVDAAKNNSKISTSAMIAANRLAIGSALAFFIGTLAGLVAFLKL